MADKSSKMAAIIIGSRYEIFFMPFSFCFKHSEIFNIALYTVHTQSDFCLSVLKLWSFKCSSSNFEHVNRKRPKVRHFRRQIS